MQANTDWHLFLQFRFFTYILSNCTAVHVGFILAQGENVIQIEPRHVISNNVAF